MEKLITSAILSLIMALGLLLVLGAPQTLAQETKDSSGTTSACPEGQICLNEAELNDKNSLDLSEILSTEGQNQSYLNDETNSPVVAFILDMINFITRVIGVIAMALIIVGGLLMIVSEGDENRIQKGKDIVIAAIIGLLLVMASYIIVRFFQSLFYLQ